MNKNKNDIIIDLTSLLDVIFILVLVILINQYKLKSEYEDQISENRAATASANEVQQLYEDQLDTQDNLNSYVYAVSIYSRYEEANPASRNLEVLREGEPCFSIALDGSNTEEAFATFEEKLTEYAQEYSNHPVIISLNEEDEYILYRDEQKITEILNGLSSRYSNVYLKGSIEE